MFPWKNPLLKLSERCLLFSKEEMSNGVKETSLNSFTSPRIKEYLSICTRKINNKEVNIGLTAGNWCAASSSFALKQCLLPGEIAPHGYRVGVVEIVSDLNEKGLWKSISEVNDGKFFPAHGDLVVFDRSNPNNPSTQWFRHIGRVYSIDNDGKGFKCISGNNGGTWKVSSHLFSQKTLLGFGSYTDVGIPSESIDWTTKDLLDINPLIDSGKNLASDDFYDIYNSVFK